MTIQNTRIQSLNNLDIVDGKYVLYWMQQSQRAECNHALEYICHPGSQSPEMRFIGGLWLDRQLPGGQPGIMGTPLKL